MAAAAPIGLGNGSQVPHIFVQYGEKRTASTLQSQILCAAMALLHRAEPKKVRCVFDQWLSQPKKLYDGHYVVAKTHRPIFLLPRGMPYWLFCSAQTATGAATLAKRTRRPVRHVQLMAAVERRGAGVATDYQSLLNLTAVQLDELLDYIRPWSAVLRQCCGAQMSKSWHRALVGNQSATLPHACASHDLDGAEAAVVASAVFRRFHAAVPTLRRVSTMDGELTGRSCTCRNRWVAQTRANMFTHIPPGVCTAKGGADKS